MNSGRKMIPFLLARAACLVAIVATGHGICAGVEGGRSSTVRDHFWIWAHEARVYAFSLDWPGEHLTLRTVKPAPGACITLVGRKEPLAWQQTDEGLVNTMPSSLRPTDTLVCAFRIPIE
jgi:hypothetical protein